MYRYSLTSRALGIFSQTVVVSRRLNHLPTVQYGAGISEPLRGQALSGRFQYFVCPKTKDE